MNRLKARPFLDGGHGPAKPKAYAPGVDEQAVAWILAETVCGLLEADPRIRPGRTRASYWETPRLSERVATANQAGADIFISIHLNDNPSPRPRGLEVYYYGRSSTGQALADKMAAAITEATGYQGPVRVIGSPSPRYKTTLYVLKRTAMPALLIEGGFLSNRQDADLYKNGTFPGAICRGIQRGTVEALKHLGRLP